MDFVVPVLLEEHRNLEAAAAMVTDGDDRPRRVYFVETSRNVPHWHELGAGDARLFEFPRLAYVEQQRLLAPRVGEPAGELGRRDLLHQKRNRGGRSAVASGGTPLSKRSTGWDGAGSGELTSPAGITRSPPPT